ncbi:MAG: glycosyltransferase [Xanthomonadales bacterium]|nr:glycosyltransferase [Xanthomonadales bacterium]
MNAGETELSEFLRRWWNQQLDLLPAYAPPARRQRSHAIDVVVPIYNALQASLACVQSLLPELIDGDLLWLINDASPDADVAPALNALAEGDPRIRLLHNPHNLGLVLTLNRAFELTSRDVLVLNSDTRVVPGALAALQAALGVPKVGIACPLSDHATLLSLPCAAEPPDDARADFAARSWHRPFPPTAVGSAMLIARALIDRIGGFDPAYSPGYGEENDYSLRARAAGFQIIAADDAYVWHDGGASFGPRAAQLRRELHTQLLEQRWRGYNQEVRRYWRANPLVGKPGGLLQPDARPRVLHLMHRLDGIGGTERFTHALIEASHDEFQHVLLAPGEADAGGAEISWHWRGRLFCIVINRAVIEAEHFLISHPADLGNPRVEGLLARLLQSLQPALVHVHHLLDFGSLLLPELIGRFGVRCVLSWHDLYALCANYSQVEHGGSDPCGRPISVDDSRCGACRQGSHRSRHGRPLAHGYASARGALLAHTLSTADAVIVPSEYLKQRLIDAYGARAEPVKVIPHGSPPASAVPDEQRLGTVRPLQVVGYFGGDDFVKGAGLVLELGERLKDLRIEFRVYGAQRRLQEHPLADRVRLCGTYEHSQLDAIYSQIDLCLIPSRYDETFSLTLSEAWQRGVPVLASDAGALAQRIRGSQSGWLEPRGDVDAWERRLRQLHACPQLLVEARQHALSPARVPALQSCVEDYRALYRGLLELGPSRQRPGGRAMPQPLAEPAFAEAVGFEIPPFPHATTSATAAGRIGVLRLPAAASAARVDAGFFESLAAHGVDVIEPASAISTQILSTLHWLVVLADGDRFHPALLRLLQELRPDCADVVLFDALISDEHGRGYARLRRTLVDPGVLARSGELGAACVFSAAALLRWEALPARTLPELMQRIPARFRWLQKPLALFQRWDANLVAQSRSLLNGPWAALEAELARPTSQGRVIEVIRDGRPAGRLVCTDGQWKRGQGGECDSHAASPALWLPAGFELAQDLIHTLLFWLEHSGADVVAPALLDAEGRSLPLGFVEAGGGSWQPLAGSSAGCSFAPTAAVPWLLPVEALFADVLLSRSGLASELAHSDDAADAIAVHAALDRRVLPGVMARLPATRMGVAPKPRKDRSRRLRQIGATLNAVTGEVPAQARAWAYGESATPRALGLMRNQWAVSKLRIEAPLRALQRAGHVQRPWLHEVQSHGLPELEALAAIDPDLMLLPPYLDEPQVCWLEACAQQLRARRVLIIDDLWTDLPQDNPLRSQLPGDLEQRLQRIARACDAVVYTTEALAQALPLPAAEHFCIGHALEPERWAPTAQRSVPTSSKRRLRVGWAGGPQHAADLAVLGEIMEATGDEFEWVFMGIAPKGAAALPMVDFDRYPAALHALQLDIALAPLVDHPFNRCKSPLKLIEYGWLDVPVIASRVGPYIDTPSLQVDSHSAEAWLAALRLLAAEPARRRDLAHALAAYSRRASPQVTLDPWRRALGLT